MTIKVIEKEEHDEERMGNLSNYLLSGDNILIFRRMDETDKEFIARVISGFED